MSDPDTNAAPRKRPKPGERRVLILQALRDTGFDGWVCAELDSWPDPAEGARLSMDYLNRAVAG